MLLLTSTSDIIRLITGTATSTIEVHASYVDVSGATVTPRRVLAYQGVLNDQLVSDIIGGL